MSVWDGPGSPEWEDDCLKWWGRVLEGRQGHWCVDWDQLPIDETCGEFHLGDIDPQNDTCRACGFNLTKAKIEEAREVAEKRAEFMRRRREYGPGPRMSFFVGRRRMIQVGSSLPKNNP